MLSRIVLSSTLLASVAAAALTAQPAILAPAVPAVAPTPPSVTAPVVPAYDPIRAVIAEWNRLRQSDGFAFADYARFLTAHPGWPGEAAMRRTAEKRLETMGADPQLVVAYFTRFPPNSPSAFARQADALSALGRTADAQRAATAAWTGGFMPADIEAGLLTRFGGGFSPTDQDRRMEALLWARATVPATRQLALASVARRPLYAARLALQGNQPGAGVAPAGFDSDPGYVVDRANWLRNTGQSPAARAYLAAPLQIQGQPYDPERYLDTLLTIARAAATDNQSSFAYAIAEKAEAAFPPGTDIRERDLDERDDYTSLVWLGGITALKKLARPADAATMFARYARAAQTPQTQTKGLYWAGRAAQAAGNAAAATAYLTEAAQHIDQFYGQLSAERLGRPLLLPPETAPAAIAPAQRAAFDASEPVRAARLLGRDGNWQDQSLFVRAIAADARDQTAHQLAVELSRQIGRPDLGVMVARNARIGTTDPVRYGFPIVSVPGPVAGDWTMIHAISRQESQFDRQANSRVGARGLMQLMPATARETATKLGLPYDYGRLTSDTQYNILLGSTYFRRMLDYYGGSHVLAIASYNAGPGNVNRFLRANGDPRMPGVDVIDWIEAIPLSETRGYVQHVLENAVVYDMMNPTRARMPATNRLSAYLGKRPS
ncbi:MAG TPA: lytic transglycosylase domain-containing protein [Sphingomonas sp.]|jgi:soluble lytic murein transglycosylase|uniref:lytic transglycosylase domain-containing protein n=1 Tax=Sphingomonas sp. TaxID=28214 RepID=UPI002EDB8CCE